MNMLERRTNIDTQALVDEYIKQFDPLSESCGIDIRIRALSHYADSIGKPLEDLTEEEVEMFRIK